MDALQHSEHAPQKMIVVCGPTASGKTGLGVALARACGGEVLSADSRQVYRGLDIGTGKDLAEYRQGGAPVPYHLVDIADPGEVYTLYRYVDDCYGALRAVSARGRLPVLVGGSGLYLEAVLKQYRIPGAPEDPALTRELMAQDKAALAAQLQDFDVPLFQKTDLSSKKRIARAIQVARYAQTHPVRWAGENPPAVAPLVLALQWPRERLAERIEKRLRARLQQGMLAEARRLQARGLSHARMLQLGLEYKYLALHLAGRMDYDTMVESLRLQICRFAKRQMTWFRGMERRGIRVHWVEGADFGKASQLMDSFLCR